MKLSGSEANAGAGGASSMRDSGKSGSVYMLACKWVEVLKGQLPRT